METEATRRKSITDITDFNPVLGLNSYVNINPPIKELNRYEKGLLLYHAGAGIAVVVIPAGMTMFQLYSALEQLLR